MRGDSPIFRRLTDRHAQSLVPLRRSVIFLALSIFFGVLIAFSFTVANRVSRQSSRARASIARCNFRVTCQLYYRFVSHSRVCLVSLVSSAVVTSKLRRRKPVSRFRALERAYRFTCIVVSNRTLTYLVRKQELFRTCEKRHSAIIESAAFFPLQTETAYRDSSIERILNRK